MATTIKMGSQNMCYGCPSFCCRISAAVTPFDILRIMEATGLEAKDFVVYSAVAADAVGFRSRSQKMELYLKRDRGVCVFLKGRPQSYCSIEELKPAVCLAYPFSIRGGTVSIRKAALCPPANLQRADVEKMSRQVLEDCQWELERYVELIDEWNSFAKGDEMPGEFLEFSVRELDLAQKPLLGPHLLRLRRFLRKVFKQRA